MSTPPSLPSVARSPGRITGPTAAGTTRRPPHPPRIPDAGARKPEPTPAPGRRAVMRIRVPLVVVLALAACGPAPSPPRDTSLSPSPPSTANEPTPVANQPTPVADQPTVDPVSALATRLAATGASVRELGGVTSLPFAGQATRLCVDGQAFTVFGYGSEQERANDAASIDPTDPAHVGTAIVEWAGTPRFWQRDRILVLYLGDDQGVVDRLTAVLGPPFATGQGRDRGPDRWAC